MKHEEKKEEKEEKKVDKEEKKVDKEEMKVEDATEAKMRAQRMRTVISVMSPRARGFEGDNAASEDA